MIDLGLFFLIAWMLHNAAVDVSCAIKGTENPRYALKRQRALAASKRAPEQPRYGSRDWFADFMSDALVAQTEWRRARAAKKAAKRDERPVTDDPVQQVDDMVDVAGVRAQSAEALKRPTPQGKPVTVSTEKFPEFEPPGSTPTTSPSAPARPVTDDPVQRVLAPTGTPPGDSTPPLVAVDRPSSPAPDTRPDAVVIPFPSKNTVKEIKMATSEVNGLTAALAFASAAADAHSSFASGGSEGYTGALVSFEVGDGCVGLAREAQEASSIAAAKWQAHVESLQEQLKVKEAYQGTPDAGNRTFLLNG